METDTEIETDIKEIGGPTWKAWVHFVDPETLTSTVWVTAQIGGGKTWGDTDVLERQNIGHFMAMLDATMEVSMNEISREQAHALGEPPFDGGHRAMSIATAESRHFRRIITFNEDVEDSRFDPHTQLLLNAWSQVDFMRRPGGSMDRDKEETPSDAEVYSWTPIITSLEFSWPGTSWDHDLADHN